VPDTPGPGNYAPKKGIGADGPKFTANGRSRELSRSTPGPGSYQPALHQVQRASSKNAFGSQKRIMLKELNSNPGPGQHKDKSQFGGPKFGFGSEARK